MKTAIPPCVGALASVFNSEVSATPRSALGRRPVVTSELSSSKCSTSRVQFRLPSWRSTCPGETFEGRVSSRPPFQPLPTPTQRQRQQRAVVHIGGSQYLGNIQLDGVFRDPKLT